MSNMKDRIGRRVKITGGMQEFIGQTGEIIGVEERMYRVMLDKPVVIEGVGSVRDDLWEGRLLQTLRDPTPAQLLAAARKELKGLGVTITHSEEWGEYRVNFRNGREATAHYTTDIEDAVGTARAMVAHRAAHQ